jgi:hypothetical protein
MGTEQSVTDVKDYNTCLAAVGCDGEVAGLIGEEVSIDFVDGHKNKMCAQVAGFLRNIFHGAIKETGHGY